MAVELVVFDLDGTLLRGPTVCEVLAGPLGHLDRMREIEQISDRDEMTAARVEMAEWCTTVERDVLLGYLEGAQLAPGAVEGCAALRSAGVRVAIASITWEFAVARFATMFGAYAWIGTTLADDGTVGHCWAETKASWVRSLGDPLRTAAVGDTTGDVPMLHEVGFPIFVGAQLPTDAPVSTLHLPAADIRDVAAAVLGRLPEEHDART